MQYREEAAQALLQSEAFRTWLIGNWSSTLTIWTVLLLFYICTMLAKGWGKGAAHAEEEGGPSQSAGYYALLAATGLMAVANKRRDVCMVRGAFFLFGVLQAAVTLHIGVSHDLPIPRMLEIESELGLEFISNLVVTAQLILVDFKPVPRFLFLGMHTICLIPFYMRVISYSMLAASLRAVSVYTFVYLAYAIIKQQLDHCFVQHQQRVQAEALKAGAGGGQELCAQTSCAQPPSPDLWPLQKDSPLVGRGTRAGLLQPHGSRVGGGGQQDAVLQGGSSIWWGNWGAREEPSGSGSEQELRTCAQGAYAAGSSARGGDPLVHRMQVFLKVYGSFGPETLHSDALAQMKHVLAVRMPCMHATNLAVRKGSLILALDLLEPVPSTQNPEPAQEHKRLQLQHEQESLLCKELQAAAFEWCKVSGLSSLLVTGNVLTLQVNNQLRSCFWDAALGSWTSQLVSEVPDHSAHHIALSSPALFLPHAPASLQRRQQQRQQQLGADLLPHQQLHMDVTFQARVSMPAGCTLVGWDYTCATSSHLDTQQQQQQQQQRKQRSMHSSNPPRQLQLLARADGSYLPVSILNSSPQPTAAPWEHEVQVQVSLPLSLVQKDGCCQLTLELWSASDAGSPQHLSSSSSSSGNSSTSRGESSNTAHHHHHHDPHPSALHEAGDAPHALSSTVAQGMQASSWTLDSSEHSSAVSALEQEAAMRAMVSNWLNDAPPPPTPHNYSHAIASAPLLLLPSSMVQEVAELEAWASGLSDPSQPPPSPALVQAFLCDLGNWMQFTHTRAAGAGCEDKGAASSSAGDSSSSNAQSQMQAGAGAGGQLPGNPPAGAAGIAAACCPKQPFLRHSDRTPQDGRAKADLVQVQRSASASRVQGASLPLLTSSTATTVGAAAQPQQACSSDSAADGQHDGEREESEGAVVEGMAEVGRALLHQAAQCGLASVAGLVVHHLMRPPFGKPFAWVVSEKEEEQALSTVDEAAPAAGSTWVPHIGDATKGARVGSKSARVYGSGMVEGFAEQERASPASPLLQRASDTRPTAAAHAQQGLGQGDRGLQRATIGGPLSSLAAEREARGGKAKRPTWMQHTTNSGGLPTCFFYSPFATDAAAKGAPAASPLAPAAAAAPASITAPHSTTSPQGAPPEGSSLHTRSSPLALLRHKPKPAVRQQHLLHNALLSGQPDMVAAVLSWGHAQPNWVWRLDQENEKGVSPRSLAQSLPQRDELVPLLLSSNAPSSRHPQPPHQPPPQAAHQGMGTHGHNSHHLDQGQSAQGQGHRGITWADQPPAAAGRATQGPNFARRGWYPGAEAAAGTAAAAATPAAPADAQAPNFARRGWFQDAAAAAYAACTGPNFARRGWFPEGEQLQGGSEISAPEERPCPTPDTHDRHQRPNLARGSGSAAGGSSSASTYTGPVASALPSRMAYYARSSAPDQHGQQGSFPVRDARWYARCSLPEEDKQVATTTMGSMAASLARFARRSRGILLSQLESSLGSVGTEPSFMNSVSSVTASSITSSSTMRPSILSQPLSSHSASSPLGNFARASTSSTTSHLPPPTSPRSPRGRATAWDHPAAATHPPSPWWSPLLHLVSYFKGEDPSASMDSSNNRGISSLQSRTAAMEVSPPAAAAGSTMLSIRRPGIVSERAGGYTAWPLRSGASSRLGSQAPTVPAIPESQEGCGGGGVAESAAAESPCGSGSRLRVAVLYGGVLGLALLVWMYVAWKGGWGSGTSLDLRVGGNGVPEADLVLGGGVPMCESSGGDAIALMGSCVAIDTSADQHHPGSVHATAPAAPQLGQEGTGRGQGEEGGDSNWRQQQGVQHLLEVPRLSRWEQGCVLLEYCIPLTLSHAALGDMTPSARKASMAVSKVSYLHLAFRAASTAALQHVLWIAYADILVTLFIDRLSKQIQAPQALTQLVMRTAVLVLLFLALGWAPGQALPSSLLLGGGVVTAAMLLMSMLTRG